MELMVVVVLIAILAAIAAPSLVRSRNDRVAFDFARRASDLVHAARSRAMGTGAAHVLVFSNDTTMGGNRGALILFEALDGEPAPAGPNPHPSCRTATLGWVGGWTPGGLASSNARFIDAVNVNDNGSGKSAQAKEDIWMAASKVRVSDGTSVPLSTFAVCITPNGTTYVGEGSSQAAAVTALATASPFTDVLELEVARHNGGPPTGTVVGLRRKVIMAGAAQPRIKSE